jgi:hypothetical protein
MIDAKSVWFMAAGGLLWAGRNLDKAARGEDVLRIKSGFEAAHEVQIGARGNPRVDTSPQRGRSEEQNCITTSAGDDLDAFGYRLAEKGHGLLVCGSRKKSEIDSAAGAGHECVAESDLLGDLLQACEEFRVVRREDADLEDGGDGRRFEQHGNRFAEAAPEGGTSGVIEDGGAAGMGFSGKAREVAGVTIEDFRCAGEGGAELPFERMKPVAHGGKRVALRLAVFAGK